MFSFIPFLNASASTQNDVSRGVRRWKTLHIHENVCDTAGFLQYNGGKLEEAEDFKFVFVVYLVFQL